MSQPTDVCAVKAFLDTDNTFDKLPSSTDNTAPESEKIKHTLIGSQRTVTVTIQVLHQLGYANINDWSPIIPSSNPGEVMSVLTRYI
ncbi:MAG: hypothetical protein IGS39_02195 [Calothrix sp. C42_A2020_038]|nr:hypothetical protein [Calothrix sp. C42_A2020_038]